MFETLTEEQQEFRSLVADFLEEKSSEAEVRRLMGTEEGYDARIWKQMAEEVGLQGIAIPEEYGGQGFSWVELGIALDEMGKKLLCAPFYSTVVMGASALLESDDEEAKTAYLPGIASGESIATLAFPGENRSWSHDGVTASASGSGSNWKLSGSAPEVIDGHIADFFIVPANTDQGVTLFIVDRGEKVKSNLVKSLDETRKIARVEFNEAVARPLGVVGGGLELLDKTLDLAAVGLACEQAGTARESLNMSVAYMKERVQFGQIIGSFQALKHMAADVLVEVESATSAAQYAAYQAAKQSDQLPAAASLAAAFCSEASVTAAHQNIQFHGGMGFTWEVPAHLYFKRARANELILGDSAFHRNRLAERIGI